jgi:hypothetical protein
MSSSKTRKLPPRFDFSIFRGASGVVGNSGGIEIQYEVDSVNENFSLGEVVCESSLFDDKTVANSGVVLSNSNETATIPFTTAETSGFQVGEYEFAIFVVNGTSKNPILHGMLHVLKGFPNV